MSQPRIRAAHGAARRVMILSARLPTLLSNFPAMLLVMLLIGVLTGCAGGGAELRYYLIDPEPVTVIRSGAPLNIEVIDLQVPQYLERFQIASRDRGNQVVYEANHQWGEPLRKNLMRALAANLTRALGSVAVATPLNRLATRPDVRVQVHVERFEVDVDGTTRLDARWQLLTRAGAPLGPERIELLGAKLRSGADPAARVAAMQTLFGVFSERLAVSIVAVLPAPAPSDGAQG